ncbi:MAG: MG2 domain-containing protein, partial [Burkholderiaceae bacterium]
MKHVDWGRLAAAWLGGVLLTTAAGVMQAQTAVPAGAIAAAGGKTLGVAEFLPQGKVSGVEAVQLRFADAAVAFGSPDTQPPVNLQCQGPAPAGQGRWLDERRWHYVFEQALPAGVDCVAVANPGFRSLDGRNLPVDLHYEFNTGAPSVVEFRPYPGWDIDEDQVFILGFNAPVDAEELARHSYCAIEGLAEKIPVRVVSDEHREALLQASHMRVPHDAAMLALLQCARVLPPESEIRLAIGPGVRALGQSDAVPASEHAHVLNYKVRAPFTASLRCTRERAGRPCLPVAPVEVVFSAPVPREALAGISLKGGGHVFEPAQGDEDEGSVSYLNYPGPFPADATLTLTLPDELRDDARRALANADRYPLTVEIADYPPLARFASGSFGVLERFAHAPPETGVAQAAAVPVTLRHIEADPVLRGAHWSAGQVTNLRTVDDAEVLRWYARLQRLESGRWSRAQLKDIIAGRAPGDDTSAWDDRIDVRAVSLLEQQAGVRRLQLPGEVGQEQRPLEVVGIPLEEPGFHVLEIESPRLGASLLENAESMYVRTGVLLTNLAVHMKQGRDDLLIWVTTLDDAQAVAAADITVLDCNGRPLARGRTDANGVWQLMATLDAPDYCNETGMGGLFVSARIAADHPQAYGSADYAFVLSGWDRGIETWRFNVPTSFDTEPVLLTHTVFDRSLFRAGETVAMKHYLRQETREGLEVPANSRPSRLLIEHEGSSQRHELPVSWEETPSGGLVALNEFSLPVSAQLGSYSVRLTDADQGWYGSSRFRVEEFRLPILAGQLVLHGGDRPDVLVAPERLSVDMQLAWLSGGPASGQKVALSAVATDRFVHFEDYDDYSFVPSTRREGGDASEDDAGERRRLFVDAHPFVLDANGTATVKLDAVPVVERPQRWQLEASFADPIGEIQTLSRHVDVWPADVQAGLKTGSWERAGRDIPVSLIALGVDAVPQEGVTMRLLAVERKTYTVRTRMVGGFYRYDSRVERRELGTLCEGLTDVSGRLHCRANFDAAGSYELVAVAEDRHGRESQASSTLWVSGAGELWFDGQDDDRIDLIPARKEWVPGEEAEFQVRMPFRDAVALVSVEREGVLWAQQVRLSGQNPVLRIPVSASWGPNAYVSVLVLRGRLYELPGKSFFQWGWKRPADWLQAFGDNPADVQVTSQVDLAKPSFRFGLSELRVAAGADRLRVELTPERDVLQVREEARVWLRVRHPDGTPAAHASVAFAAVDEALLELAPNDSWSLYEAMHPRRSLSVRTATTQMEVVGRRHYGRKAVAAGVGGGAMPTRQLFDTLLSWQPMVVLDSNGEAELGFRLNDALSRFRLVAVADHGGGSFGSGTASIVTRQDMQLVPGLPPVVREGDEYRVEVTVRNGSDHNREIEVHARYQQQGAETGLPPRKLRLDPAQSGSVSWPVTVPTLAWPRDRAEMAWQFDAGAAGLSDSVALTQRIEPRLPTATLQASLL